MSTEKKKAPNPRPWMDVEPEPLPDEDDARLAAVLEFADMIAESDEAVDAVALRKAEALESLYQSMSWVDEWNRARPVKPDAIGRPVEPNSRNRFADWLAWRAVKSDHAQLEKSRVYQLLKARTVLQHFVGPGPINSEKALRPLSWMLTHGYAERIPEVEQSIRQAAVGKAITPAVTRKALSEWKAKNLSRKDIDKGKRIARSRPIRERCNDDFAELLNENPEEARAFIVWAQDAFREAAKSKFTVVAR